MTIPLPGHGVLIELEQTGVYIIGQSGVGKSETALQLIEQGATLICDDAPIMSPGSEKQPLQGHCPEGFYGLMHLRDLGIINLIELFGKQSFEAEHSIDFIIELIPSKQAVEAPEYKQWQYQSWTIPGIRIHLYPNRNIPVLIKIAVMQFNNLSPETREHKQ